MEKKAGKVIEGENLDLLVGSIPLESEEKDAVKKRCSCNPFKRIWNGRGRFLSQQS